MAVVQKRKTGFQISYVTITYRSVAWVVLALTCLAGVVMYFIFPDASNRALSSGQVSVGKLLARMGLAGASAQGTEPGPQQAHFTSPDGTVGFTQFPGNSTHAAIAAEAGLAFALDPKWSVVPAYRFEHLFTTGNAFPNDANIFKLGFRYSM